MEVISNKNFYFELGIGYVNNNDDNVFFIFFRKEVLLYLCCYWVKEKYCCLVGEKIDRCW